MAGSHRSGGSFSFAGVPLQGHCCCLYEGSQQRAAILIELIKAARARGEKCIYATQGDIGAVLEKSLRADGLDVRAALESGALEVRKAEATYGGAGGRDSDGTAIDWRQLARQAERDGFTGLSVATEAPRSAHGGPHSSGWLEYERKLTQMVRKLGGTFLCVYDRRTTSLRAALEILRAHPAGLASGIIGRSVYYESAEEGGFSVRRLRPDTSADGRITLPRQEAGSLGQEGLARMSRLFAMGSLTASIAHEVTQPLAAVTANANAGLRWLKASRPRVDLARKSLARILRDANRAADIITHIRSLAARGSTAGKRLLDINTIVRQVLALIEGEIRRAHAVLHLELNDDIPRIPGDEVQLQQVVLNLLTNALEAMAHITNRPKEIAILTRRGPDGRIIVTVRDSGTAGSSENLTRVFELFYTTKPHGMGVGLSICRAIVEGHDGHLWATRNEGPGAAFHFSLPARRGAHR